MNYCRLCCVVVGRPRTYHSVEAQQAIYGPMLRPTHKPAVAATAALTADVVTVAADESPG